MADTGSLKVDASGGVQDGISRIRLVLRVLAGFVALYGSLWLIRVVMGVGPNLLMKQFGASPNIRAFIGSTLNYGVGIAAYIMLPALALQCLAKSRLRESFFAMQPGWLKDIGLGSLLEGGLLALLFLVESKAGWLRVDYWKWEVVPADAFIRTAWVGLLINLGVAIGEETVFRGYLLTGLRSAVGKWGGLALMMILFGSFHLPAYLAAGFRSAGLWLALGLATLLGGLFGLTYMRTGSLWLPVALHFTWNFVENDLLNLTADVTNPNLVGAVMRLRFPLSMNGNDFGNQIVLEAFVAAMLALGIWLWLRNRPEPQSIRSPRLVPLQKEKT